MQNELQKSIQTEKPYAKVTTLILTSIALPIAPHYKYTPFYRHSDEREFLCANCGKQFKRKDKLTEHMRNMHSEERERKNLEIMNNVSNKAKSLSKKSSKKRLPTKVLVHTPSTHHVCY